MRLNAGVFQRATAGQQGAFDQRGDQRIKLATGHLPLPAADVHPRRLGIAEGDFRRDRRVKQLALQAVITAIAQASLLAQIIGQQMIEIVAAERGIAAGGQDFKHAAAQAQHGDIKSTAAEIVNRDDPFLTGVQAVGYRRRGRLVQQTQHVQARQTRRVFGSLPLSIIEVGRHGNHHAVELARQRLGGAFGQRF